MKTILVSANDTNAGKTSVIKILVEKLCLLGKKVQVVKLVETGVKKPQDAKRATEGSCAEDYTLFTYEAPLAPVCAAKEINQRFGIDLVLNKVNQLDDQVDFRIYEAAGGLACPLDENGQDVRDLIKLLNIDKLILVVENRLGAINQARLLEYYVKDINIHKGFWLYNVNNLDQKVEDSNLREINKLKAPLWGRNNNIYYNFYDI